MSTTNSLVLNEKLHKSIGDWIREPVSSNIAAGDKITCANLAKYDEGQPDFFKNYWVYVENFLNEGEDRKVRKYYQANYTLNVYGPNFTSDASNMSYIRLHQMSYSDADNALDDAMRETYPTLHKWVTDRSLATNKDLFEYPIPSSFDDGDIYSVAINFHTGDTITSTQQLFTHDHHFSVVNEGNTLRLSELHPSGYLIKLDGIVPLGGDNVNVSGPQVDLLVAYAKYKIYDQVGLVSSEDMTRYERASAKALGEYKRLLPKARMTMPGRPLKIGG